MTKEQVASMIDHTLLSPTAGTRKITNLCTEAKKYGFASVCVNPVNVTIATSELAGSKVKVCTVVGFPLGASSTKVKAFEASTAVMEGADEIDMVIDVAAALDGRLSNVQSDILEVVESSKKAGKELGKNILVKVILETCFLDDKTISDCCKCAVKAGADFVKTSTGFATPKAPSGNLLPNGASTYHVELMRKTVGSDCGVKASGGIRNSRAAADLIMAGASRIGASSGIQILENWDESTELPVWER